MNIKYNFSLNIILAKQCVNKNSDNSKNCSQYFQLDLLVGYIDKWSISASLSGIK